MKSGSLEGRQLLLGHMCGSVVVEGQGMTCQDRCQIENRVQATLPCAQLSLAPT